MSKDTLSVISTSSSIEDDVKALEKKYVGLFEVNGTAIFGQVLSDIDADTSRAMAIEATEKTKKMMSVMAKENLKLVTSIPKSHFERVSKALIEHPGNLEVITKRLGEIEGMSDRYAKNLALDQTRKTYQGVAIQKAQSAGASKGIWIHSKGSKKPRHRHLEYHGKEFDLAVGAPVGDNGGNMVQPSEEPNCKCTFKLVFSVEPK